MNKPEYVKVDDKLYKINTDFRIAIQCNKIANDSTIGEYERALAIIYKLFGEDGLNCVENQSQLLEKAIRYISLDSDEKSIRNDFEKNFELDFEKCEGLIRSSFKFDYNYDPYELDYLHWYDFYNDLANLSSSEFGTCCILNRVMSILDADASKIKDNKEREELYKAQAQLKKKYCVSVKEDMTDKEKESVASLYKKLGLWKGGDS